MVPKGWFVPLTLADLVQEGKEPWMGCWLSGTGIAGG